MLLFDQLRISGFRCCVPTPEHLVQPTREASQQWVAELQKWMPVVVRVGNVSDYYWEGTQETWMMEDFPSLAPPWPLTFLEYHAPRTIVDCDGTVVPFDRESLGYRFGVLLDSAVAGEKPGFSGIPGPFQEFLPGHRGTPAVAGLKWWQQASVFTERRGDILLRGTFAWFIGPAGEFLYPREEMGGLPFLPPFRVKVEEDEQRDLCRNCWCFLVPALLAISFIHCRNTALVDHAPDPALVKATERRHAIRPVTFKTLEIEPIKKILAEHGDPAARGLRLALHICRGHFKDYRSSKGLFGKHKALYWWDRHVRGHVEEGLVIKDYALGGKKK